MYIIYICVCVCVCVCIHQYIEYFGEHFLYLKIYFGTHHARIYLSMAFLGVTCASGMSFLTKKSIIEETGGLQHYSQYLAEDYFLTVDLQR